MGAKADYDVLIIGGGINGAGIARDAAGRGLRVLLCEQDDLANHTSSASTKLIHGGLRYLEYYEFGLVRKALRERETLLSMAPHIIWPLRFVMPHVRELRPAWMIRTGLFLYDHLGGREQLPASSGINLRQHPAGAPLMSQYRRGFVYSDCWTQDARLVVLNAMDAAANGAVIKPRTQCLDARRHRDRWQVALRSTVDGHLVDVSAATLVNAAGPWVDRVLSVTARTPDTHRLQLVKGSHIILPRLFDHDYAYIFQHTDGRIIFAIPYEGDYTLVGTTDVAYRGDPAAASASQQEIDYLCAAVSRYFRQPVAAADVVSTYAGVRALYEQHTRVSASAASRDYKLDLKTAGGAPLLSVFGGKITTHRTLSEQAVDKLAHALGRSGTPWTAGAALPGGDMPNSDCNAYLDSVKQRYPWLGGHLATRLTRTYGTRVHRIIGDARELDHLGQHFGHGLYAAELNYLATHEWAQTSDDVLWRRTKLGLKFSQDQAAAIDAWLANQCAALSSAC